MIDVALPTTPEAKIKAASAAVSAINKNFGKGSIMRMGDRPKVKMDVIPTGIYGLDYDVLGVGGFPRGRIIEIYGPESSGKTTLSLLAIANAQRKGELAAFIDVEHALDPAWAEVQGVIVDDLYVSQPDYGEQALEIVENLVVCGGYSIIVVDSVAALVPKAELDGEMGDAFVGLHARLMSQAMRKLTGPVSKTNTTLIFINQIREKIGVMFGSPETTSGGRALKFYASVRLDIRRQTAIKEKEVTEGNQTKIKCVKNKVSAPFREVMVDLKYGSGFSADGSVFDAAVAVGVIEKSGAWYYYAGEKLGQGRENALDMLVSLGKVDEVLAKVRDKAENGTGTTVPTDTSGTPAQPNT